jgi:SAM-dependent methyltransferase
MARDIRNMLVNRVIDRALEDVAPEASGRMLDVGCGIKPYRKVFAPFIDEHVGLDHEATPHGLEQADLVGTAYDIPAPAESFDTVLCTAVLEHLEEPAKALRETHRVLRPGGTVILTAPFIWHLHEEPRDFFRYSKHGLVHLFESTGFEVDHVRPLAGFWTTFGQLLAYYVYRFDRGPVRALRLIPALAVLIQVIAGLFDRVDRAEEWTWMYLVVARARTASAEVRA